jgi:DNA-binding response OmpR family regulator
MSIIKEMRLLVIEDEHKIANSIRQGLEQEGFVVDVAYTGTTGYDLASTENFDLIILDLMLPELNGMDICTKLRKENNQTPILMLTAKSELEDKIEGLTKGADDYLTKPFAFVELLARIKALLRRPTAIVSETLKCGNLELNTKNFEVTRNRQKIELSKKEYVLLEYLMRNKNRVLSKENIAEHVWSYDSDILINTVEVYIRYLRNKIDKPFKEEPSLIKTSRGFGYKLEEINV